MTCIDDVIFFRDSEFISSDIVKNKNIRLFDFQLLKTFIIFFAVQPIISINKLDIYSLGIVNTKISCCSRTLIFLIYISYIFVFTDNLFRRYIRAVINKNYFVFIVR